MATLQDDRFIHSNMARVVMGLIGVLMLGLIVTIWNEEVIAFANSFGDETQTPLVQTPGVQRIVEENPALAACLEERLGHVQQMQEDGVIGEEQAASFSQRATALCNAQNPA